MLTLLYREKISEETRQRIYTAFLGRWLRFTRTFNEHVRFKTIFLFYPFLPKTEINKCKAFMGRYGITPYPYPYSLKYRKEPVEVKRDDQAGMYYVMHEGKRMYYPQDYDEQQIIDNYRNLLIEQDPASAHCYVLDGSQLDGRVLLDMGAAEGSFTLTHIDRIARAWVFECESKWVEALRYTFAPWRDKVTIVEKYIGDKNCDNATTIDTFLEGKSVERLFLKMDIEGSETGALWASPKVFAESKDLGFAICAYHTVNDASYIAQFLKGIGVHYAFASGYLYFEKAFRRGVVRHYHKGGKA